MNSASSTQDILLTYYWHIIDTCPAKPHSSVCAMHTWMHQMYIKINKSCFTIVMFVFVGVTIVVNEYHHPKEGKGLFGKKRVYLVYAFT